MLDVLNLTEKYNLGITKEKWFELRELRNLMVHEYKEQTERIAEIVNKIYQEINYLKFLVNKLKL